MEGLGTVRVGGRNELLLESVQAAETGPPRDLSEEAVAIGDWEGDRGAMEEARQILKEPVENRRRIEDGWPDAPGGKIQAVAGGSTTGASG